jgi:predicted DNA-binding transcriptional regulator AlpA
MTRHAKTVSFPAVSEASALADRTGLSVPPVKPAGAIAPLLWKFEDVIRALNVSRRSLERLRSAGRFPAPDLHIGKRPMWKPESVRAWIDEQSCKGMRR